MSNEVAILDACVLYPAPLRDVLMSLATAKEPLYRVKWTETILDEWTRNLLDNRPDLPREQLERTCRLMNAAAPDALISGFEGKIDELILPDPGDRHVLAAAITGSAGSIVSFNTKHFPDRALAPFRIKCVEPDTLIQQFLDTSPSKVVDALYQMRARLTKPRKTVDEFLDLLALQKLPRTVDRLREFQRVL